MPSVRGVPKPQAVLAREMTRLVHGQEGLDAAERITESLFRGSLERRCRESDLYCNCARMVMPASGAVACMQFPETLTQLLTADSVWRASGKQVKECPGAQCGNRRSTGLEVGLGWQCRRRGPVFECRAAAVHQRFLPGQTGQEKAPPVSKLA